MSRPATTEDRARVLDLTVAAFAADPIIRWFFPDDQDYPALASQFFGIVLDLRLRAGIVEVDDEVTGAAQWEPPGGLDLPDDVQDAAWAPHVAARDDRSESRFAAVEEAFEPHVPAQPYWYLGVLAVDPTHQGRGIGRSLATAGCRRADEDGLPSFLETGTPRNVPFYESLGFTATGEVDLPDDGPHVWFMSRPPRP